MATDILGALSLDKRFFFIIGGPEPSEKQSGWPGVAQQAISNTFAQDGHLEWSGYQGPNTLPDAQSPVEDGHLENKSKVDPTLQELEKWLNENGSEAEINSDFEQFPSRPESTASVSKPSSGNPCNSATYASDTDPHDSGQLIKEWNSETALVHSENLLRLMRKDRHLEKEGEAKSPSEPASIGTHVSKPSSDNLLIRDASGQLTFYGKLVKEDDLGKLSVNAFRQPTFDGERVRILSQSSLAKEARKRRNGISSPGTLILHKGQLLQTLSRKPSAQRMRVLRTARKKAKSNPSGRAEEVTVRTFTEKGQTYPYFAYA